MKAGGSTLSVGLCLLWLLVPGVWGLLEEDRSVSERENRRLQTLPEAPTDLDNVGEWRDRWASYLRDQVGLREPVTSLYGGALYGMGVSPTSKVLLGEDGFLFAGRAVRGGLDVLGQVTGKILLNDGELAALGQAWRLNVEEARKRKVPYLLAMIPNKHWVYRDKLPERWRHRISDFTMRHQVGVLAAELGLPYLDLADALGEGRSTRQVWHRFDTHWSSWGSLMANNELMRAFRKHLALPVSPIDVAQIECRDARHKNQDLARMAGLAGFLVGSEPDCRLPNLPPLLSRRELPADGRPPTTLYEFDNPTGPRILVTHDSFLWKLLPHLQVAFSQVILVKDSGQKAPWELLDELRVDAVASVSVELNLMYRVAKHRRGPSVAMAPGNFQR